MKYPLLHFRLEIPFVSIWTDLMYRRLECRTIEYVVFHVRVWKWSFEFALYDTDMRKKRKELEAALRKGG